MSPSEKLPICKVSQGRIIKSNKERETNRTIPRPGGCNHYTICLHSTHDSPDHYRPPRPELQHQHQHGGHSVQAALAAPSGRSHSRLSRKCQDGSQSQPSKVSRNSILTLSIIVILYLVCNAPRLTLNTAEYLIRFNSFYLSMGRYLDIHLWPGGRFHTPTLALVG